MTYNLSALATELKSSIELGYASGSQILSEQGYPNTLVQIETEIADSANANHYLLEQKITLSIRENPLFIWIKLAEPGFENPEEPNRFMTYTDIEYPIGNRGIAVVQHPCHSQEDTIRLWRENVEQALSLIPSRYF